MQLWVISTFYLPAFSFPLQRNLDPEVAFRSSCLVSGQPRIPPECQNSRLLCLIGFFSVHIAYMFAIYEPRVSTWPVQGWEPNSCLRTSKRQERQEPGRWTSSSQIQEDLQSQTEWQHLAPLFMVFLLHFTRRTFVGKVMSLLLNMLSRLLVTFLPRSKRFLISWLQSPSAVILEPPKIKSDTVSTVSPSISYEVMGPDAMIFIF